MVCYNGYKYTNDEIIPWLYGKSTNNYDKQIAIDSFCPDLNNQTKPRAMIFQIFIFWRVRFKLLFFLFSWPPACAVWPNYELVMFQPWSGISPSLGSVATVTSYLSLSHCFNCNYVSFSFNLCVPTNPPSAALRLICTTIFTQFYPHSQVPVIPCNPAPQARLCHLIPVPVVPLSLPSASLLSLSTPVGYST